MALRALEDQSVADEYVRLKAVAKLVEARIKELHDEEIFAAVLEEPGEKAFHRGAELKIQYRKQWKYSEDLEQRKKEIKALEKLEQANGAAHYESETGFIVCSVKDDAEVWGEAYKLFEQLRGGKNVAGIIAAADAEF